MANAFGLLLTAVIACGLIGRIEHSSRKFWSLVLALAIGFVGGAMYSKITNVTEKSSNIVLKESVENNVSTSTFLFAETPIVGKSVSSRSEGMGQKYPTFDVLHTFTPRVQTVHPVRCLSPPFINIFEYG